MMNKQFLLFVFFILITRLSPQALALARVTAAPSLSASHETARSASTSSSPITAEQYCAFLNTVAATDEHQLYCEQMGSDAQAACIVRSGNAGAYEYSVITGKENTNVPFLTWSCAARYCNWIENSSQATGDRLHENETETGVYDFNDANDIVPPNPGATCTIISDEIVDPSFACNQVTFSVVIPSNDLTLWPGGDDDASGYDVEKDVLIGAGIIATIIGVRYAFSGCYGETFKERAPEAPGYDIGTGFDIEQIPCAHIDSVIREPQESRTDPPSNRTTPKNLVTPDPVKKVVLNKLPEVSPDDQTSKARWNKSVLGVLIPTRIEDYNSYSEHFYSLPPHEKAKYEEPSNFNYSPSTPQKKVTENCFLDPASAPQLLSNIISKRYEDYEQALKKAVEQAESSEAALAEEAIVASQNFKWRQQHYSLAEAPNEFATKEKTSTNLKKAWLQARTHTRWMKMTLEKFNERDNPSYHLSWKDEADWTAWADWAINEPSPHPVCWQDWHQWKNDDEHQEWYQENSRRIASYSSFRPSTERTLQLSEEDPSTGTRVKESREDFSSFLPHLETLNNTYEKAFSQFYNTREISRQDFETAFHHYNDSLQPFLTNFKDVIDYVNLCKSSGNNEDSISSTLDGSPHPSSPSPDHGKKESSSDHNRDELRQNSFDSTQQAGRNSPDNSCDLFKSNKLPERRQTISMTKSGGSIEMPVLERSSSAP